MSSSLSRRLRLGLLVVLLAVGAAAAFRAAHRFRAYRQADAICDAARRGDWRATVELGSRLPGPTTARRRAAECRCVAQLELGDADACVTTLEELIAPGDWLPLPELTGHVVEQRKREGRLQEAASLAHRGAVEHPESLLLALQELDLRTRLEDEGEVIRDIRRRSEANPDSPPALRIHLADRFLAREEWQDALDTLGETPPDAPETRRRWYFKRTLAEAALGNRPGLEETFAAWARDGGEPAELRAQHAVLRSVFGIEDPRISVLDELLAAVADADRIGDQELLGVLYKRTVNHLALAGRKEKAVALEEEARDRGLEVMDEASVERLLRPERTGSEGPGRLVFRVADVEPGDRLFVSAPPDHPVDDPFASVGLTEGRATVQRTPGDVPVRWVLRDAEGEVVGSGAVWPLGGERLDVAITRRTGVAPLEPFDPDAIPAGDGRRRVFLVVLDSGDWRLVQYLRARGEMPVLDRMARSGVRGVLDSYPAFTGAAMQALVTPNKRGVGSFFGLLYQLGREVETMNFVGRNPAEPLRWLLPEEADLFGVLGSGDLVTANLLRAFGAIQYGRHARLVGPRGRVREVAAYRGFRSLTEAELREHPELAVDTANDRGFAEEMAADFDTIVTLATQGEVDFAALRVDSLDMATHAHLDTASVGGQDDGTGFLFALYRYADARLAELLRAADRDDILLVISDHGARNALEHDRRCLFLATGGGAPHLRVPDRPELRGMGRLIATLFGVETNWPATGIETWAESLPPYSPNSSP